MAPGIPNPLNQLVSLPAEVLAVLRVLPEIAESTRAMEKHTAALNRMSKTMEEVAGDTNALPGLRKDMARVAKTTSVLEPMDGRMATIEDAMPVLVEVQQDLARVPDALESLDANMRELSSLLERFLSSTDKLSASVESLHEAVGPLGRIAGKLPGQKND